MFSTSNLSSTCASRSGIGALGRSAKNELLHPADALVSGIVDMNSLLYPRMFSSGVVEGMNQMVGLTRGKAFGYRSFELLKISLFHAFGELPEPEFTRKFR